MKTNQKQNNQKDQKKNGYRSDNVLKESGVKDIFGAFESKESQMKRDNSRKSIGKK